LARAAARADVVSFPQATQNTASSATPSARNFLEHPDLLVI
jgi:hypothetical protein